MSPNSTDAGITSGPSVTAQVTYMKDTGRRAWQYIRPRHKGDDHDSDNGGTPAMMRVPMNDGRMSVEPLMLDKHGFQLVTGEATSLSLEEFYKHTNRGAGEEGNNEIDSVYYPEIEDVIRRATGASEVVCFNHQVRNAERGTNTKVNGTIQGYASVAHIDTSAHSAEGQFQKALAHLCKTKGAEHAEPLKKGRFMYVNAWRNIAEEPIQDNHLAVCDDTSIVKPDDYIACDFYDEGYHAVEYRLSSRNAHRHRWYYFPKMTRDEILLFKQWDSDVELSGRSCFHTSFADPGVLGAPVRQSIEVRCIAFFPDHEPNTCPPPPVSIGGEEDEKTASAADDAANKILESIDYIYSWSWMDRQWFLNKVSKAREGMDSMMDDLIRYDSGNQYGLKGVKDPGLIAAVKARLVVNGEFYVRCIKGASLLKKKTLNTLVETSDGDNDDNINAMIDEAVKSLFK